MATTIDAREVVFVLDRSTEMLLLKRVLAQCDDAGATVLALIDQVRQHGSTSPSTAPLQPLRHVASSSPLPEMLERRFATSVAPLVLRVLPAPNLARQNLSTFVCLGARHGVTCPKEICVARRLAICSKHAASNKRLLDYFNVTDSVRCCELPPPGGDLFSGEHLHVVGIPDDDTLGDIAARGSQPRYSPR